MLRPVSLAEGEMKSVAHFDTYPPDERSGYHQTADPYIEDQVLMSRIGQGLFILRPQLGER